MSSTSTSKRYALVTGCSEGGMGWYVAREFGRRGIHTFATLRNVDRAGSLKSEPNVTVLPMDVSSTSSIEACVAEVGRQTGGRLDILYNNAGALYIMPVADTNIPLAKRVFDANFWGLIETTQKFLPLLVAAKGYVANAGSVRAHMTQEYDGIYGATKAAVTIISQNMQVEFAPLGVRVSCVHIGAVKTPIFDKNPTNVDFDLPRDSYYQSIESQIRGIAAGSRMSGRVGRTPMGADEFAKKLVADVLDGQTGSIWRGTYSTMIRFLRKLPSWFLLTVLIQDDSGLPALAKQRAAAEGKSK